MDNPQQIILPIFLYEAVNTIASENNQTIEETIILLLERALSRPFPGQSELATQSPGSENDVG